MYVWKLDEDRIEFDRVLPAMLQTDPDGCYVVQRDDGTLLLRSGGAADETIGDRLLLCGVEFDLDEFDPMRELTTA